MRLADPISRASRCKWALNADTCAPIRLLSTNLLLWLTSAVALPKELSAPDSTRAVEVASPANYEDFLVQIRLQHQGIVRDHGPVANRRSRHCAAHIVVT